MKVHDVMTHTVVTVLPKASIKEVWKTLFQSKVNALPVVDEKKKLCGIITKEDLLKKLYPDYIDLVEDFSQASDFEAMELKFDALSDITAENLMNSRVIFTRADTLIMSKSATGA
ncbi:MAG: CBS domain-containing protein [Patescibacteria group bacterium]|nr:CBS domain-containing protein [Patescibacteria group bacterium]